SVTFIDEGAFMDNALETVVISQSIAHIGKGAFVGNNLINVTIPESILLTNKEIFDEWVKIIGY
ncbi:hypothetical protein EA004_27985, partial [Vibrio anguillarum]|nr:hypothetical protein [Vibrio anguillarum]